VLVLSIFIIIVIIARPELMLFAITFGYMISGPIGKLLGLFRRNRDDKEQPRSESQADDEEAGEKV